MHFLLSRLLPHIALPAMIHSFDNKQQNQKQAARTDVAVMKDELVLQGTSIRDVSLSASLVHGATLVKRKDIRKFLDGIYVSVKENIEQVV